MQEVSYQQGQTPEPSPQGKGAEKSQAWFLATNQWAGTPAGSGLREEALRRKLVLQDWGKQHGVMGST